ncbi:MAG: hypothetical protein JO127_05005 [Caulobacteraceae bacterium]|nr:hypothetical protein [Caulobacteraceae bacterium]
MISIEDCIAFCGLTQEEVDAVAEHEHVPEAAATALANYLLNSSGGADRIRTMIIDDIHVALDEGRVEHAAELFAALRHFLSAHPAKADGKARA